MKLMFSIFILICILSIDAQAFNLSLEKTGLTYATSGIWQKTFNISMYTIWDNITFTSNQPAGTAICFRVRTAPDNSSLGSASWSDCISTSGQPLNVEDNHWAEVLVNMTTNDTSKTPFLNGFSLFYSHWSPPLQAENDGTYKTELELLTRLDIASVTDYTWHRNGIAKIVFAGQTNLSGVTDIDPIINVANRLAYVNSSALSSLNKSASITFYGIDCADPNAQQIYYSEIAYSLDDIISTGILCPDCAAKTCLGGTDGNLSFTVTHFSGYAAGSNANLTIYDEIEESGEKDVNEDVSFYANYTSSGNHISSASCNISFDDAPGTWYEMTESSGNYNYTKTGGFSSIGTHIWAVTCDHESYSVLYANDTIYVTSTAVIPEFSEPGLLLACIIIITIAITIERIRE